MHEKNPSAEVNEAFFREVSHANSLRKFADRYKEDREEAMEYTEHFSTNRNGARSIPDSWDDRWNDQAGKYVTKPKKNNHHGNATIRKNPALFEMMFNDELPEDDEYDR